MAKDRTSRESAARRPAADALKGVVGVGASAGGLEALQEFLGPLTPGAMAFVVAQHLAPDHPSLIVELLSRSTELEVVEAVDGAELSAGVVAVAPPNHDVTVEGDRLRLVEPPERLGPSPSIDLLFESLAEHWGTSAIAVVLSGTGSDGARGLRAVRGGGGLTMVQSPESARFDGMPRAAMALGGVDLVADAATLGARLTVLSSGIDEAEVEPRVAQLDALPSITTQLKRSIGIDFSKYKQSTLQRQVQRRMAIRQIDDVDSYLAVLVGDADEAHALSANLLVTVTSFFRDPEAFDALRLEVARYLERPEADEVLRVWVPGCATGEEVYSIAMLVSDILGNPADLAQRLKIFGTDLDEPSLAVARRAVYPAAALARIPKHLRAAYIREAGDDFQIAEVLRECTVFARHDVGTDPPFPRIDLISCRNTLIYFTAPLQQRVVSMFGFALKAGGLLVLGTAETLDRRAEGFSTVNAEWRIFTHEGNASFPYEHAPAPAVGRATKQSLAVPRQRVSPDEPNAADTALLEELVRFSGNAFLVLDERHALARVVGDVSPYCRVPEGRMTASVGSFLRPELRDEARALLLLCRTGAEPVTSQSLTLEGLDHSIHLSASRVQVGEDSLTVLAFVADTDDPATRPAPESRSASFDSELMRLERDLITSQDTLRRSMSELQAVNEELEASSEELQASSEELQASNEELQASNEELQATNEELGTLNQESRQRGDALQQLNTDLVNIQTSVSQGMIIVDQDLRVTRFTPLAVRVFALVDADLGHPLLSAPTTLAIPGLDVALSEVVGGAERQSIQVGDSSVSYLVQVLPYLGVDGRRLGAIITLTDVTEMVALRTTAEDALVELQATSELLARQAAFDSLTGLLNRGYFSDALENEIARAIRSGGQLALAWIDLDRFKEVNDEYGHASGDVTLRTMGERIVSVVRATDVVGRLGGDEIGVIIAGFETAAELDSVLERLVETLRQPVAVEGMETRVSGSIGVALYPDDAQTPKDLLRAADAAMYDIKKRAGDGIAFFTQSMNDAAGERRHMRAAIAAAIDRGEFELHYQPIVDAVTDALWGVEALVRWRRAGELVPACDFVPFCEESGQIRALGMLTLAELRKDLPAIRAGRHEGFRVAYNMSVTQLEDRNVTDILSMVQRPDALVGIVVEIVESVFLPDHAQALRLLDALVALGAETSIDDYGSGYSNIRLLESVAPTYIKLDRTFLSQYHSFESRSALIRSAVEISHVVGAKVVVEGVETDEQRRLVVDAGADYVQGYGIARPMPLSDLLTWFGEHDGR